MNRFVKITIIVILFEFVLLVVLNLAYDKYKNKEDGYYRVEAQRLTKRLLNGETDIDISKYSTLTGYEIYDPEIICNEHYLIKDVNGVLYRITYKGLDDRWSLMYFNVTFIIMIIITAGVFLYIYLKLLKPFYKVSNITIEIAKGNLSMPVKQERSKFLGRFLWGVDMLREKIEEGKSRNLEYEKQKKTMLLSLSHDIKTPLAAISLYVKALIEGIYDGEDKKREVLNSILDKTDEIKGYVDDIYTYARDDFMNFEVNVSEVYLDDIIKSINTYYADKLGVIHTALMIDDYDNCLLSADPDRLIECMQNLMENAIKYGDGKSIHIGFDEEEDCKLITVENSGCNLAEEEINNIFDSFYRGSNTSGIQGNGLGLYIVRKLMRLVGGDVYAKRNEDSFAVTLVVKKV